MDSAAKIDSVIAEARSWIGTPCKHLGRAKGVGVDCLGLIEGVGLAAGVLEAADFLADYGGYYGRLPNPKRLVAGLERHLARIDPRERRSSDILLLAWGDDAQPMHLAILAYLSGRETMIHAHGRAKPPRVVEHGLVGEWARPGRCHGVFRYPGLV